MKKLLSAYIFCFIVITTGICSASVPDEQVALGGISYQSSSSYVKSIYGEPDRVTSTNNDPLYKTVEKYYYGNSFLVEFSNSKAVWISISAHNGLATPAGVEVGMKMSTLHDVYGPPTKVARDRNGKVTMYYYGSYKSEYIGLRFDIKNETITKISAGSFD